MNNASSRPAFPDRFARPTAHRFSGTWDTVAVARIIREQSEAGRSPSFLYLGAEEASLLRGHLVAAFGEDSVSTLLHETYYMGLKVILVDAERYISTGGSKEARTIQAPGFRRAS